jgi:hypothetical protein
MNSNRRPPATSIAGLRCCRNGTSSTVRRNGAGGCERSATARSPTRTVGE